MPIIIFRILFIVIIILFYFGEIYTQKQNHIWYFGKEAGLDFNSNPPAATQSPLTTLEGTASVCDPSGNLLFYTNGESVWDRNHNIMPNGNGLLGGESSAQAALIVPLPNSCSKYYVFTTEDHYSNGGLTYSIVDMCLNNGMGDIVSGSKNILLLDRSAEKITAILHANGTDIWILTHRLNSREFLSFLLTSTGINVVPVISAVGSFYPTDAIIGPAKANHGGTKVVSVATFYGICDMLDFDRATGRLSNFFDLNQLFTGSKWFYGIEFSPDDNILYLSTTYVTCYLYQVDLQTNQITTLNTENGHYHYGALQYGANGKIYMARNNSGFLDVIHNPNVKGAGCMYDEGNISLKAGTNSYLGLPNLVPYSFFQEPYHAFSLGPDTTICNGASIDYSLQTPVGCTASFEWNDGTTTQNKVITQPGVYWVEINNDCIIQRDTVQVDFYSQPSTEITRNICLGNVLEGYTESGIYTDTFTSVNGCDSIRILDLAVVPLEIFLDVVICEGDYFDGYSVAGQYIDTLAGIPGDCDTVRNLNLFVSPPLPSTISHSICEGDIFMGYSATGVYIDTFQTNNGCDSIRVLDLTVENQIYSTQYETICFEETYDGYSESGIYIDTLQSVFGCDSIRTLFLNTLEAIIVNVKAPLCQAVSYGHTQAGIYVDTLVSATGCDSIRILDIQGESKYIPNVFSPNGDGINDEFLIHASPDFSARFLYFGLFDRFGDMVYETHSWPVQWKGKDIKSRAFQPGVFAFVLIYRCNDKEVIEVGNVTLIK